MDEELPMESMESMPVSTGNGEATTNNGDVTMGFVDRFRTLFIRSSRSKDTIAPYQELIISKKVFKRSVNCLRFAVFVDAIAGRVEQPNYPIMVLPRGSPGAHSDSFPSTEPFGFSAATYFVPMSALLGVTIASLVIGKISDTRGRKPCILLCLYGTVVGCILKYLVRRNFWAYNAVNFLNGLFSASVPVALAYAGDVNETKREKDAEIGFLVGISMLGTAGGGIIAILMQTQGLFVPLLVGAAITAVAAIINTFMLIEPRHIVASRMREREEMGLAADDDDEDAVKAPTELNKKVFGVIIFGAFLDNVGSSGLNPLCLSPLAFNTFYTNFIEQGLDPIMPVVAYKWISVLVALMVVPGTILSPPIYNKIGLAGGCILGNVITGVVTIALLSTALAPPSQATFAIFVTLFFASFPFAVISQLSTGPMLEAVSPVDKRGFCQGFNITVMNFGAAVTPFLLGLVSDQFGTPAAIWICVGVSFLAAVVNVPLIRVDGCNIPDKPRPKELRPLKGEDKEMVEKALRGEWIPAEELEAINERRFRNRQPYLLIHPRKFSEEKDELPMLRNRAKKDFLFQQTRLKVYLNEVNTTDDISALCDKVNFSMRASDPAEVEQINRDIGEWFKDYLVDSGYTPQLDSVLIKQAVMSAFPVLGKTNQEGYTPDNIEDYLLSSGRVYTQLIENEGFDERSHNQSFTRVLTNARSAMLQQNI